MKEFLKKNKIKFLIAFTLIISLTFTTYYIYTNNTPKETISPKVKEIIKKNKTNKNQNTNNDNKQIEKKDTYINQLPNYRNQYNNQSIFGKLVIPELEINTLVTKTNNNSYYIDHDIYNNYSILGNPQK